MKKYYIEPNQKIVDLGPHSSVLQSMSIVEEEKDTQWVREERNFDESAPAGRASLWDNEW